MPIARSVAQAPARATPRVTAPAPKSATITKETHADIDNNVTGSRSVGLGKVEVPVQHGNIGLSRSFTIKQGDDFIKIGVTINMPASVEDLMNGTALATVSKLVTGILDAESVVAAEQYSTLTAGTGSLDDGTPEAEVSEVAEAGDQDDTLTPEKLAGMPRAEVNKTVSDYGFDDPASYPDGTIDLSDYPNNKAGTQALKNAITALVFSDEATPEAEPEPEPEPAQEGVTEEDIRAMDRRGLLAIIAENKLDIDEKKYPKQAALAAKIIEALQAAAEAAEQELGEAGGNDPENEAGDEAYTAEALQSYSIDDLKAIYDTWQMGAFPSGPPAVQKKNAIKAILAFQEPA